MKTAGSLATGRTSRGRRRNCSQIDQRRRPIIHITVPREQPASDGDALLSSRSDTEKAPPSTGRLNSTVMTAGFSDTAAHPTRRQKADSVGWRSIRAMTSVQQRIMQPIAPICHDKPADTGLPRLEDLGYRATAADSSPHMLEMARGCCREQRGITEIPDTITFTQADVMATGCADSAFDAVSCNRLLHPYPTCELRRGALTELAPRRPGRSSCAARPAHSHPAGDAVV